MLLQEASSHRPAIRPERRRQLTAEMTACAPQALSLLTDCLKKHGKAVCKMAVPCPYVLRIGPLAGCKQRCKVIHYPTSSKACEQKVRPTECPSLAWHTAAGPGGLAQHVSPLHAAEAQQQGLNRVCPYDSDIWSCLSNTLLQAWSQACAKWICIAAPGRAAYVMHRAIKAINCTPPVALTSICIPVYVNQHLR